VAEGSHRQTGSCKFGTSGNVRKSQSDGGGEYNLLRNFPLREKISSEEGGVSETRCLWEKKPKNDMKQGISTQG